MLASVAIIVKGLHATYAARICFVYMKHIDIIAQMENAVMAVIVKRKIMLINIGIVNGAGILDLHVNRCPGSINKS